MAKYAGQIKQNSRRSSESVGGYLSEAIIGLLTFSKMNPRSIPNNYSFSFIFQFIISLIVSLILIFPIIGELSTTITIIVLLIPVMWNLIRSSLFCFTFSFVGSIILDEEHSPEQFAINTTTFACIPVLYLVQRTSIPPEYILIPELIVTFFMTNNLIINFKPYYKGKEKTRRILHSLFLFMGCFIVIKMASR